MKIGIMTFHWAANYGAILQTFALQQYLEQIGHNVEIINYRPRKYDLNVFRIICHPRSGIKTLSKQMYDYRKNKLLEAFRQEYLHQTKRFTTTLELQSLNEQYDLVISGSDQILNPSFTLYGEDYPTAAYYLDFIPKAKRIGYSVSFGCDEYPSDAAQYAKRWINNFDVISVREKTGLNILLSLGYKGEVTVTPDPTILCGRKLVDALPVKKTISNGCTCVYMLRTTLSINDSNVIYLDDKNKSLGMMEWLDTICNSRLVITNSYHGSILSMLYNTPFVVVLNNGNDISMNNRFYTLFEELGVSDRICYNVVDMKSIADKPIDWPSLNRRIVEYGLIGAEYLRKCL